MNSETALRPYRAGLVGFGLGGRRIARPRNIPRRTIRRRYIRTWIWGRLGRRIGCRRAGLYADVFHSSLSTAIQIFPVDGRMQSPVKACVWDREAAAVPADLEREEAPGRAAVSEEDWDSGLGPGLVADLELTWCHHFARGRDSSQTNTNIQVLCLPVDYLSHTRMWSQMPGRSLAARRFLALTGCRYRSVLELRQFVAVPRQLAGCGSK